MFIIWNYTWNSKKLQAENFLSKNVMLCYSRSVFDFFLILVYSKWKHVCKRRKHMKEIKLTRKEQAAETKKHLFHTALTLLGQKEFDKITIRDIVSAAGVSIGTFYNYYNTKLDVYYETYIIADEYFETVVRKELAAYSDPVEKLLHFFDAYAKYSSEITSLDLTRILYNSANKCFDRQSDTGMMSLLLSILDEGMRTGIFDRQNTAPQLGQFLMISIRGQVYHWCTNDGRYNLRDAVAGHVKMLLPVILDHNRQ